MLRATVLAMLLVLEFAAFGQESAPANQKFEIGVWNVPRGFIEAINSSSSQSTPLKLVPGFRSNQPPGLSQYDAKEFLELSGITFPPGSEAIFDASTGNLVVRNTRENLELVDSLTGGGPVAPPFNIAIEISTFECSLTAEYSSTEAPWPSYFKLIKSSPAPQLLDRVSAVTKSGVRAAMNHVITTTSAAPSAMPSAKTAGICFQDGEWGTISESEPVVGPDSKTIDANIIYRFRKPGANNAASEITLNTSFTANDGLPVVIWISPSPTEKGKFIVVVANIRLASYRDWGLEKGSPGASTGETEKSGP
jgi:hypothetical protein